MVDYNFREIYEKYSESEEELFQSDSIYIHELAKTLQDILPNLFITSAEGRSNTKINVSTAKTSGDGSFYLSKHYDSLTIKLKGFLSCSSTEELNLHTQAMNRWLQLPQFKFSFLDERDYYRVGTFSNFEVEEGTLEPSVTMTIECADPFKYKNDLVEYNQYYMFTHNDIYSCGILQNGRAKPESIEISWSGDVSGEFYNGFEIQCRGREDQGDELKRKIKINQFSDNSNGASTCVLEMRLNATDGVYCYLNGEPMNKIVDITSDIYDFTIGIEDHFYVDTTPKFVTNAKFKFRTKDLG